MKKSIIKIVFWLIFVTVLNVLTTSINPIITNYMALNQMYNTIDSSLWIQIYSRLSFLYPIFIGLLLYLTLHNEVKKIYKHLKEKINNEKN